jgi:hypothetical protein
VDRVRSLVLCSAQLLVQGLGERMVAPRVEVAARAGSGWPVLQRCACRAAAPLGRALVSMAEWCPGGAGQAGVCYHPPVPERPSESPEEKKAPMTGPLLVSDQDREGERIRREIAEKQEAEYVECLKWALSAFGPGWLPSHRHMLVEKNEEERTRHSGERAKAAAVVYTVKNKDGDRRHFTVTDGKVVPCASYEEGFGDLLHAKHPTRGFEHKGAFVRTHRYSLCWAGYDLYHPKTAEQLAALRVSREKGKADRADKKFAEDHPLLAAAGIRRQDIEPE